MATKNNNKTENYPEKIDLRTNQTFETLADAEKALYLKAKDAGFAVSRKDSKLNPKRGFPYVVFQCTQGGKYRVTHQELYERDPLRVRESIKRECDFQVRLSCKKGLWTVGQVVDSHNHIKMLPEEIHGFPQFRKMNMEQLDVVEKAFNADGQSFSTMKMANNLGGDVPKVSVKDVINAKAKIRRALDGGENRKTMEALMRLLEENGYIIKKKVNDAGEMTHIFFAHPKIFKQV